MIVPAKLLANCGKTAERRAWLEKLPAAVADLIDRWSLRVGSPFQDATAAWVAPAVRVDGAAAVLKLSMPHMEAAQEIEGLRFWDGNPTVRLLEADEALGALLLERCEPGTALGSEPETEQDAVIAGLAKRLRQAKVSPERRFRHLSEMVAFWCEETLAQRGFWPDAALVREGLDVMQRLAAPAAWDVVLATDLHAGNVLRADREPWLVIDPKPFVGDPAYELAQHLQVCERRLHADPFRLIRRVADLAEVDAERLRLWTFARAAADPREDWRNSLWIDIARALAP